MAHFILENKYFSFTALFVLALSFFGVGRIATGYCSETLGDHERETFMTQSKPGEKAVEEFLMRGESKIMFKHREPYRWTEYEIIVYQVSFDAERTQSPLTTGPVQQYLVEKRRYWTAVLPDHIADRLPANCVVLDQLGARVIQ